MSGSSLDNLYIRPSAASLPDVVSRSMEALRAERDSPGLSCDEIKQVVGQLDILVEGCGEVFAFLLHALPAAPPTQSWHDQAAGLDTWAVEYDNVLSGIPPSVRKCKHDGAVSPYKSRRLARFPRARPSGPGACAARSLPPLQVDMDETMTRTARTIMVILLLLHPPRAA